MKPSFWLACLSVLTACVPDPQARSRPPAPAPRNPQITVTAGAQSRTLTREDLLKLHQVKVITVDHDPAYGGRAMTYTAVPMSEVLAGLPIDEESILSFSCLDGFSAPIDAARVLNTDRNGAVAYLAIEMDGQRWPRLKPGEEARAGPFYLVWQDPEKSNIGREEWPFQLVGFEVKPPLAVQFPHILPDPAVPRGSLIRQGLQVFVKSCFSCHTMNGEGTSRLGPDLNVPFNPTEYLKPGFLARQIRDPQGVRRWPQSRMAGFDAATLSDADLDAVIRYLQHMAARRSRATKSAEENGARRAP